MFMIVSQKGRNLIAMGEKLLRVWGMADVYDAAQAYECGRIKFSRKQGIVQLGEGRKLRCQISDMESVLGELSLCVIRIPACGEEIVEEVEDDVGYYSTPKRIEKDDIDLTNALLESIVQDKKEIDTKDSKKIPKIDENKKETPKLKVESKVETQKEKKQDTSNKKESTPIMDDVLDDLDIIFDDEPKKETKSQPENKKVDSPPLGASHIISQPKDMESTLDSKEVEKQKIENNSGGIDIDSFLMNDDENDSFLMDDQKESKKEKKSSTPELKDDEFDLDGMFDEPETKTKKEESSKEEIEIELDDFLLEDEKEKPQNISEPKLEKKSEKVKEEKPEPQKDDEFSFDDFLDEEPAPQKAPEAKKESKSLDDDFDFDLDIFDQDDEVKESKPKLKSDEKIVEVAFEDDDLDLDSIFEISQDSDSDSKPEAKKTEVKVEETSKKDDDFLDDDLDFDSLFGDSSGHSVQTKESKSIDDDLDIDDLDIDSLFEKKEPTKKVEPKIEIEDDIPTLEPESKPSNLEEDLFALKDELNKMKKSVVEVTPDTSPAQTLSGSINRWRALVNEFDIDIEENAKKIEFSVEEYEDLLESFIRDSKDMENTLRFGSPQDRSSVISTLSDAVSMLHLNPLDELLRDISKSGDDASEVIDTFYSILSNIEEKIEKSKDKRNFATNQPAPTQNDELIIPEVEDSTANGNNVEVLSVEEFLKDVKMIPIEFSIKLAADELNLPDDLVLEFVNDFSNQGHENIPELIDAYQQGDLDRLQKIAHMLKGAASNLRIEPMVQNLYDLQFDNDLSRAPERIKLFAGQLMSLDKYLQQMSN
jgi:hypothetical protein